MRIAIVNDMPMAVEALRRALSFEPAHQVVWVASNGLEAVQHCAEVVPDLILMDLIMPVMDGVEATRRIMAETPCPIVIVTVDRQANVSRVFEAMGHGALDVVDTPALGVGNAKDAAAPLLRKILNIGWLAGRSARQPGAHRDGAPARHRQTSKPGGDWFVGRRAGCPGNPAQGFATGLFGGHRAGAACGSGVRRGHGRVAEQRVRPAGAPGA